MKLLGYCDPWSGKPGDCVQFMVSSEETAFDVDIVRLLQVDSRADGPAYREEVVAADCSGCYPGKRKPLLTGSFLRAPNHRLFETASFCLTLWIYPTTVGRGRQGLYGKSSPVSGGGYDLMLSSNGCLRFELKQRCGQTISLESPQLLDSDWYFVAAGFDSSTGQAMLWHKRKNARAPHLASGAKAHLISAAADVVEPTGIDLLIGALHDNESTWVTARFNGKVATPTVYHRALSLTEVAHLYENKDIEAHGLSAQWNLAAYPFSTIIPDRSGNKLIAKVINNPTRAVTGPHWDGSAGNFSANPAQYDAIYFHDDDLDDAGWPADFVWNIPLDTPSGVYAARLRSHGAEDYVPFVVKPTRACANVLLILPTFTYQAYANERFHSHPSVDWTVASDLPLHLSPQDQFSAQTPELGGSLYDVHTDGSINCYSSRRRPVVNFRPKLTSYWNGAVRHFGADMYLVDWLDRQSIAHDVVTDHDFHAEGLALLSQYKVALLGSHPEYFSWPMRHALEDYIKQGGRLMYLGGNGCAWVTGVDPARPHVIEVRKPVPDASIPGLGVEYAEEILSTTGQRGGTWRAVGRGPEMMFGVGTAAQGFCRARGYKRQPDSFSPRVEFIFNGIEDAEIIGDFGLAFGGAAGDEFDRAFLGSGSPADTYILASSFDHPKKYCVNYSAIPYQPAEGHIESLRSDLTYYEIPGGGAVFSAGSMCWCTSLPHNNYENNVSRLTANVLRHFLEDRE